ncbi:hypothetical protein ACFQE8_03225 [Salinirubellus sp. GCM10025818]|uniref:hypothetical protein n=1 Tax=Salinirubellus TaxID=2162630 RepID=UPI0030CED7FA
MTKTLERDLGLPAVVAISMGARAPRLASPLADPFDSGSVGRRAEYGECPPCPPHRVVADRRDPAARNGQ